MENSSSGNIHREREYDLTDILTISWNIFSRNYTHFFTIVFFVFFPSYLIINYLFPRPEIFSLEASMNPGMLIGYVIEAFVSMIATIAIIYSVYDAYKGEPMDYKKAFNHAGKKLLPALLTTIMALFIILAGTVLLIIPGIIAAVYLTFYLHAVVLRDVWSADALRYSYYLIKNRFWKVLGYTIVFGVMNLLTGGLLISVFEMFNIHEVISAVFYTLVSIINAFFFIVYAVFFLNLDDTKDFEFVD